MTRFWFVLGSVVGGLLLGAALLGIHEVGRMLPQEGIVTLTAAGALLVAALAIRNVTPPALHRQVDHRWLDRFRGWVVGGGFGFQLGAGVFTRIPSYGLYLTALCALAGAPESTLLAGGLLYGAVRGISASPGGWVRNSQQLQRLNRLSLSLDAPTATFARVVDIASAGALVAALLLMIA